MTNGMKPGSGTDPFADVDSDDESGESDERDSPAENQVDSSSKAETSADTEATTSKSTVDPTSSNLPFIYARDGVKQARSHTFQLHYLDGTYQQEKRVQSDLEDRLGEDVYKVDLREAMIQAAFDNLDDVEAVLREWGYDAE